MAKKSKKGRKNSPTKESYSPAKSKNFFEKVYDLSIGRVRVVAIVLVLVGLGLIFLGGMNLFNTIKDKLEDKKETTEGTIDDGIQTEAKNENNGGDENENESENSSGVQEVSETAKLARIASHNKSVKSGKWVATDYKRGDIKPGKYEIQKGDTLWEISEAVYGSGFQWHKILDANPSAIGFLPNGSQAKIIPGQILTLPPK